MSYSSVCTSAPFATLPSITGRIVACRTSASIRTTTSPPRWSRPSTGGLSFASAPRPRAPPRPRAGAVPPPVGCPSRACRARARPSAAAGGPGAPFGDRGRVTLVAGHHVDLVDLDLAPKDRRRELGGEPLPQRLGYGLHVGDAEVQLPGDLPVGEVQAHQVQAQHPEPEGPVAAGQDGAGQVVEAGATPHTAVTLPVRLGVVPAVAGDVGSFAMRAADALGPAVLPDQLEASRVIDQ